MSAPLSNLAAQPDVAEDALTLAIAALAAQKALLPKATLSARLDAFEALSDGLLNGSANTLPGAAFLAAFLRRGHVEELLKREIPQLEALDKFVACGPRSEMRIFPRGAVCHWIAGNVPLLGVFSWAFSAMFGNVNLIRVSSRNDDVLSPIIERVGGVSAAGAEMAERTRVVSFERDDTPRHILMSEFADIRVAWGGEEAVSAVRSLPAQWECDDLVFGPRRSFAVVDPSLVDARMATRLANDIVYFDQLACSSPQVVFVRAAPGSSELADFVERMKVAINLGTMQFRRHELDWSETYLIELDRQRAILEGGAIHRDQFTQWTIAVVDAPVGQISCANRFIQIVPYASTDFIANFLPRNSQTVVLVLPEEDARQTSVTLGAKGVCRFPRPGLGNSFEIPWDGVAVAPRLGHFVTRAT